MKWKWLIQEYLSEENKKIYIYEQTASFPLGPTLEVPG